MIRRSR